MNTEKTGAGWVRTSDLSRVKRPSDYRKTARRLMNSGFRVP
jgi:hypothetical protein